MKNKLKKTPIKTQKESKFKSQGVKKVPGKGVKKLPGKRVTKSPKIEREKSSESELEGTHSSKELFESDLSKDYVIEKEKDNVSDSDIDINSDVDEADKHKKDLEKLKKSDPDFYKFLQENDKKLLQFGLSDEENEEEEQEEKFHKPNENLEVASDESDFEPEDDLSKSKDEQAITLKMLKAWQVDIRNDKSNKTILELTRAFHAALCRISSEDSDNEPAYYKVDGASVFNGIIQLCVLELGPAVRRFLGLHHGSKQLPHKCKKFIKVKNMLKSYFSNLLKLLLGITSSSIQTVLLKHLHYMSNLLISFPNITKLLVKRLIHIWGTSEDSVRVLAFFCILRITNNQRTTMLDVVLKSMYMTYVKNSKFVSLKTLSVINFMRRSLVEMYALDTSVSYQHVFLYIRQLAIHLRNAVNVNKKENIQAVYNWQFINSLKLWGNLLAVTYHKTTMQQLVYPFVQVCLGTIRLVPTTQYYPLRFHIVQVLMDLEKDTGVFIPILPFLLEILTTYDFNQKHKKVSMKPMHFTCILRLSKSQLQENGFKDMVIETIYGLLLEYLNMHSHTLTFPDLTLVCTQQIKVFLKHCRNPNHTRKFKQILEKINQNSQFIENERTLLTVNITETKKIEGFEAQIKNKGTPISNFFESWNKLRTIKKNKMLTNNDQLADYKLPTLNKNKKTQNKKSEGPVELFPSDSEEEEEQSGPKNKRRKRGIKKIQKTISNEIEQDKDDDKQDIVEDINADDW